MEMSCSFRIGTNSLVFPFCKSRWASSQLCWLGRCSYRKAMIQSACKKSQYSCIWTSFLKGKVGFWAQLIFSDSGFPRVVLLLTVVMKEVEGMPGNVLPAAPDSSALFAEKTVMVFIQTLGSLLHVEGYPLLLRGQVKAHSSEMCDLPHTMGKMRIVLIWYRSTPI